MNSEDSTTRGYNSAKAKMNKAIALLSEAAAKFEIDSNRRKRIIHATQALEETFRDVFAEEPKQ